MPTSSSDMLTLKPTEILMKKLKINCAVYGSINGVQLEILWITQRNREHFS